MYNLVVSNHYPNINEINIPRDVTIDIYLNKEIDTKSIKQNNIIVTDYLYIPVKGEVSFKYTNSGTPSGIANILTFRPYTFLDPQTTYIVTIPKYPDSIKGIDSSFIQEAYSYRFSTGIISTSNTTPTYLEQLLMDLAAAIARQDWCEAARIQAIINGATNSCGIPISGIGPNLPESLIITNTYPINIESNIYLNKLQYIKLTFNDIMPSSGIDYSYYIDVTSKNVLE